MDTIKLIILYFSWSSYIVSKLTNSVLWVFMLVETKIVLLWTLESHMLQNKLAQHLVKRNWKAVCLTILCRILGHFFALDCLKFCTVTSVHSQNIAEHFCLRFALSRVNVKGPVGSHSFFGHWKSPACEWSANHRKKKWDKSNVLWTNWIESPLRKLKKKTKKKTADENLT